MEVHDHANAWQEEPVLAKNRTAWIRMQALRPLGDIKPPKVYTWGPM